MTIHDARQGSFRSARTCNAASARLRASLLTGTALASALIALFPAPAAAQSTSWTGQSGTNWADANNWSGIIPTTDTTTTINTTSPNPTVLFGQSGATGSVGVGNAAGTSGNLKIENGGTLTSSSTIRIGDRGTGVVTVTGQGSTWTTTHSGSLSALIVGNFAPGVGTLTISNGGSFSATGQRVAFGDEVGAHGTLNVQSGGTMAAGIDAVFGIGTGIATVTGADSLFTVGRNLILGNSGTGTGTLTIDDSGSVTVGGNTIVGNVAGATSTLTIQNGGALTQTGTSSLSIGSGSTVTVTGTDSSLTGGNGQIKVGTTTGPGQLNVSDGGSVSGYRVDIALDQNTEGHVVVSGTGSEIDTSGVTTNPWMSVGFGGTGTLEITDGGTVTSPIGQIATTATGDGTVTVDGNGSSWMITGSVPLHVGGEGTGELTIQNSGLVKADGGTIIAQKAGSTGTLDVDSDGVLATTALKGGAGTRQANFDGGHLRATANNNDFVTGFTGTELNIAGGGLTIDDGGFQIVAHSPFTGSGELRKRGGGELTLTRDNTYGGGTVIEAGELVVGDGGNSGSITGNVTVEGNGTLVFNRGNAYTFDGTISGAGKVEQNGLSTLTLAADNTYQGGTSIDNGSTLQLGNGGTTGSAGTGDIANEGALIFNRSNALTVAGVISGTGSVEQKGSGTTTLTGDNSYTGTTTVTGGTLLIDGNQSGAIGQTTVDSGGTLGGRGTIGGNVRTNSGGTLTSFDNNADGINTLTINGNLSLGHGSTLDYNYGLSPNNDHDALMLDVKGNVDLGGHLKVENNTSPQVDFDPGVYGLIHYDGTLGGTFATEDLPTGFVLQTSVDGRVNIVNTAGLDLDYWDGPGTPNDNRIEGGSGTWQASGDDNWTSVDGSTNAGFNNGSFAVFQGTAGTVTVDNTNGQVTVSDMQFATDGYIITGGAITLGTDPATITVGDNTENGGAFTETIESVLQGSAGLIKDDLGTLVLTGNNTYSGGTTIEGGTLSISQDRNLGAEGTGLTIDGGTLQNTAQFTSDRNVTLEAGGGTFQNDTDPDAFLRLTGVISGPGALTKTGAGRLALSGTNTYQGGTTIEEGVLVIGQGILGGSPTGSIVGDVTNNGTLEFARSNTYAFDGEITGSGRVAQIGDGTTILTGDSDYTGGTRIVHGALQLGDGGTSGSITGDVRVDQDGTFIFNRSDDALTLDGTISGEGSVAQIGSGTTTLTADNSYKGTTDVSGGTLLIDGDQSAATGATTVASGGTLSGEGTVGGDATVDDGGTLLSFDNDQDGVEKLTINGDLGLQSGANLDYTYGQSPNGDHDALMMEVGGDVILGGTLNVVNNSGQDFDPGVYGLIHYGGILAGSFDSTNLPSGDFFVQTSVPGRVNLANTAGLELNVWDGPGTPNDGVIEGGDGTWQGPGGNTDWTDVDGTPNASFADDSFAIFQGTPGTVTVDNSQGQVNVAGMQFAVDGYTITGEAVTLGADPAIFRVGDGSPNGVGDTATIESVLQGDAELVKADLGTLVLTGNNTYAGGTELDAGTLSVSSDENLGAAGTGLTFDGGILQVTGTDYKTTDRPITWGTFGGGFDIADADNTFTLDQTFSGSGPLDKLGPGTLVLNGDSSGFAGQTDILDGTLEVNGSLCGPMMVRSGGTLAGTGTVCDTTNFAGGTISPAGPGAIGTLTINGNYTSNGGNLAIDSVLGDDASRTDLLVITSDTIMGTGKTQIFVDNLDGDGGETFGDGIKIVQVDGSSTADLFELGAPAIGGEWSYDLFFDSGDGDWYLRNGGLAPTVPTYEAYAATLLGLIEPPTLRQRVGNRYYALAGGGGADLPTAEEQAIASMGYTGGRNLWTRIEAAHGHVEGESTLGTEYDQTRYLVQLGLDGQLADRGTGIVIGGLTAHYAHGESDISSETGDGDSSADSYGVGVTLTWYGDNGLYVDGQATVAYLSSDLNADDVGELVSDNGGWGAGLSIETGKKIAIGGNWSVTPQAQLSYASVDFDDFTDPFDADVSLKSGDSLKGRLGVAFDYDALDAGGGNRRHLYTVANLTYEFLDGTSIDVDGTVLDFEPDDFGGELGIGGSYEWAGGKYAVHGEALAQTSFEGSYGFKGTAGFTTRF